MFEVNDFDSVRISLASSDQIKSWSYGEVTKAETINYRTLKPERDGLFCERIFGPTKDYECFCGKYKRIRYKGVICDKCGVEVAQARVRRERMGHIELACPVSHVWYARGVPSRLGLLIDLSPRNIERVLYFSSYVITSVDEKARGEAIKELEEGSNAEIAKSQSELEAKISGMTEASVEEVNRLRQDWETKKDKLGEEASGDIEQLKDLAPRQLLTEAQYQDLRIRYGHVFDAGMGAEAILKLIKEVNLNELRNQLILETRSNSGQRRKKASKQLQVVEAFRRSGSKPEWMILTILPVLPPDLRPMVQLDGGKFAISGINDLYRRVINRNNRLRHLMEIGAPEIIVRNEKRMLQDAVDSLIDNSRRGQTAPAAGNHKLKSLSDMLRGKQGRFRQNLLGKRVDYSGRSVIVVGPDLKLYQCGLPKRMALELFKPFVMRRLMQLGLAHNIRSARRLVERAKPEVYDMLEEVVKERPVLLNRAPTLHRLSIQAFEPVLIDGSAIQLHPLVCTAFNADFDGDQMAVHVPLSKAAVKEAREEMLSIRNILIPSSGEPIVTPTLDMVLGCYYMTTLSPGAKGEGKVFANFEDAKLAYEIGSIDLRAEVEFRRKDAERLKTSVGRILLNEIMPENIGFANRVVDKAGLKKIVFDAAKVLGPEDMAKLLDNIKLLGFRFATKSGTTIGMGDVQVPPAKAALLSNAETQTSTIENQYQRGLISEDERYDAVVRVWTDMGDKIRTAVSDSLDRRGGVYMMATSGAKGNISQITQMAGMRGLMTNPSGKIIDFPIKSSFREGLSVLEYFISTHGARKGLADTALRTSESGYLTRRLIDAAHDVIVLEADCGTTQGVWMNEPKEKGLLPSMADRIIGRYAAASVVDPKTGEIIVDRNGEIDDVKIASMVAAGINRVYVRTPLSCQSRRGICQMCYGRDLARGHIVDMYTAVGIIAAQSIGEPGTQLTLRTFHTGGVVGLDITSGLPRVEELFEARMPRNPAIISDINGTAEIVRSDEGDKIRIVGSETFRTEYSLPSALTLRVENGQWVEVGAILASAGPLADKEQLPATDGQPLIAGVAGQIAIEGDRVAVTYEEKEEREYAVAAAAHIRVQNGDPVRAGQQLTDGSINPQEMLSILGRDAVQQYLADEVQRVYRSQGVNINDKHIEIIIHQMLARVRVDTAGDTELVPGELIDRFEYEEKNAEVLAEGGEPATAHTVLLGVTRASLSTNSWLAAASFQETTKVLTEAAVRGAVDKLSGLKENVIIGRLIPARSRASLAAAVLAKKEEPADLLAEIEPEVPPPGFLAEPVAELPEDNAVAEDEAPASPEEIVEVEDSEE
jgi:DNA-directed RNA polymerase subunit beta'